MLTKEDKNWILENTASRKDFVGFKDEINEKLDNMISAIDHFMGKTNKIELEQTSLSGRIHQTIIPNVDNHEKRITKLESSNPSFVSVV